MFTKKGFVSIVLCCILLFLAIPTTTWANDNVYRKCYITTSECPKEYIAYATENISKYILSINPSAKEDNIFVGTPFAFGQTNADIFYFPIICDGNIKYLFRVYPDGDSFSAVITEFLAKELNELAPLTSVDKPMSVQMINEKIIAVIGNEQYVLHEYPIEMSNSNVFSVQKVMDNTVVCDVKSPSRMKLNLMQTRDVSKYINLNITETQGNNNWCVGYCLAAIIRTRTTFTTSARSIATMTLGSNPSTESVVPWEQIQTISKKYGLNPTVLTKTVSNAVLSSQINAGRPCIVAMYPDNGDMGHAVVLRGYNTTGIWSIWNPWYRYYESYAMDGAYVPTGAVGTVAYYPGRHAYNF